MPKVTVWSLINQHVHSDYSHLCAIRYLCHLHVMLLPCAINLHDAINTCKETKEVRPKVIFPHQIKGRFYGQGQTD